MNYFFCGVLLFLTAGIITVFIKDKWKNIFFTCLSIIALFLILPQSFSTMIYGNIVTMQLNLSGPVGIAVLRLDPLASFFSLIISIGSVFASIYSIKYMEHYTAGRYSLSSFYFFFGLLITSMLLVVVVQNAILFLIVWELMSVSSFFLVIFESDKDEVRKAGIYYLIAMQIGASFLIVSFAWITNLTGSNDFESFKNILGSGGNISIILFVIFFIGFATKAGFVPFHTWLPKAHPAAPTGISAVMSGVMIKTGIYGILRIILLSGGLNTNIAYGVFIISLITGIFGIVNAVSQKDIKKLLAYSSIENIGIIGMGIGLGMLGSVYDQPLVALLGYSGAILHILNHFIFKSILFYGSGIVYQNTGTKNMERLGGLIKSMPVVSTLFFIGTAAICGLPMLNGFVGEFAVYLGMANGFSSPNIAFNIMMLIGFSGLALTGIIAMLGFTKLYGIVFLGNPREKFEFEPKDGNLFLVVPMILLSAAVGVIGLFPLPALKSLTNVLKQFSTLDITANLNNIFSIYSSLGNAVLTLFGFILFFLLLRYFLLRKKIVRLFKTWDCGYQQESSRAQYSGSSFSLPFIELVAEFVPQKTIVETQKEIFPVEAKLKTSQHDLLERIFIQPSLKYIRQFLMLFSWIQSGRLQQYILYGLIFLIIILIWIIGVA